MTNPWVLYRCVTYGPFEKSVDQRLSLMLHSGPSFCLYSLTREDVFSETREA